MSIFKKSAPTSSAQPANRLAAGLATDEGGAFSKAFDEVCALSRKDNAESVRVLREAIRLRSGQANARFYELGLHPIPVEGYDARTKQAKPNLLKLAEKRALLSDTWASGEYIASCPQVWGDSKDFDSLLADIRMAGGSKALHDFNLLYLEMTLSRKGRR
jgi:hypothetical protein